jgi:hypothetical protein
VGDDKPGLTEWLVRTLLLVSAEEYLTIRAVSIAGFYHRWKLTEELLRSSSFLTWSPGPKPVTQPTISVGRGHSFSYKGKTYKNLIVDERHYAPADLAKVWGVDVETIRNLFR